MTRIHHTTSNSSFDARIAGALNTVVLTLAAVLLFVTLTPA
jgi:hypothetical protein